MEKKYNKYYLLMLRKVFTVVSYILISLCMGVEILSKKSMGVYRELLFRKEILESRIFSPSLLNIYKWILIVGIVYTIIITILRGNYGIDKANRYIKLTMGLSIMLLIMIVFYDKVDLITYPLLVVSISIIVILRYIMIILIRIYSKALYQ